MRVKQMKADIWLAPVILISRVACLVSAGPGWRYAASESYSGTDCSPPHAVSYQKQESRSQFSHFLTKHSIDLCPHLIPE